MTFAATAITIESSFENEFRSALTDRERKAIKYAIRNTSERDGSEATNDHSVPSWKIIDGLAYYGNRVYVPESLRKRVLFTTHDRETLHGGTKKTIDALQRKFYWPGMGKDVQSWLRTCDTCQRKERPYALGFLSPLDVPQGRFTDLAMDFFNVPPGNMDVQRPADRMRNIIDRAHAATHAAQTRQKKYYDRGRRQERLVVGDLVLVDREGLSVSKDYTLPFIGPFRVISVEG